MSDDALERTTIRAMSWRLLPLIGLGYGIAFMDRVNISFAALQMNRDLHFSAAVYGLGAGLAALVAPYLIAVTIVLVLRADQRRRLRAAA